MGSLYPSLLVVEPSLFGASWLINLISHDEWILVACPIYNWCPIQNWGTAPVANQLLSEIMQRPAPKCEVTETGEPWSSRLKTAPETHVVLPTGNFTNTI